ncbi:MAG TPA: CBS domain-containing protein, partial [Acidobacteriota bacterium]|nr:CBS domain-containing protein [Acidobacteriota bacterium]
FRDLDVPRPESGLQADLLLDPVSKILSRSVDWVTPQDTISKALELMSRRRKGCLPVVEKGRLCGILTEVDLLLKVQAKEQDLTKTPVSTVLTPNPETIEENASISDALHKMSIGGYRHIPVVREGSLVGVLSGKDVLRYLAERLS